MIVMSRQQLPLCSKACLTAESLPLDEGPMSDIHNQVPFPQLKYCSRCCMPDTTEGIGFDEMGICKACRASEEKMRIDWKQRGEALASLLADAKLQAGDNYDCMVPI